MSRRRLINEVTTNPGFLVLMSVLVAGTTGLLIRDLHAEASTLDLALRAATVACWLVLLVAGLIGRHRQRGQRLRSEDPGSRPPEGGLSIWTLKRNVDGVFGRRR